MNWKIIVGFLLLLGAIKELGTVVMDYRSGTLALWPWGVTIGFAVVLVVSFSLILKGVKEKNGNKTR